jgi:hypothetical protein
VAAYFSLRYCDIKSLRLSYYCASCCCYEFANVALLLVQSCEIMDAVLMLDRYDERVRSLLDFSIYLDISDDVKFAWKIQV